MLPAATFPDAHSKDNALQPSQHETVLFLCTGNYYRSRFAEIFFNWHAKKFNLPWRAESRGLRLDAANSGYMSRYTISRLGRMEIPVAEYLRYPQDLTLNDLSSVQHIVAVKATEHRPLMSARFPEWLDKVEFWEVHDIDCSDPEEALPHLEQEVKGLMQRLTEGLKTSHTSDASANRSVPQPEFVTRRVLTTQYEAR